MCCQVGAALEDMMNKSTQAMGDWEKVLHYIWLVFRQFFPTRGEICRRSEDAHMTTMEVNNTYEGLGEVEMKMRQQTGGQ